MTDGADPTDPATSPDVSPAVRMEVAHAARGLLVLVGAVEVLAILSSMQLGLSKYLDPSMRDLAHAAELVLVACFTLIVVAAFTEWRAGRYRLAIRLLFVYAVVVTVQVVVDVILEVLATQGHENRGLWYLADLAFVLALNVVVFAIWYVILDVTVPEGVLVFPSRSGQRPERGVVDYLFLAFNTSMTFGPTVETPVDRRAKVIMMLQTVLAVTILVVLAARIVGP
jgi:hypothetical protein